jgi:predicted dehydrogenase
MLHSTPLRVVIVGTGVMGGHHTRVAAMSRDCTLVGIYDASAERAEQVARQHGVQAFTSLEEACAAADAVIVATPTNTHAEVAERCLRAGCHVLLEKPIAATVAEAEALVAYSTTVDRVLMIGHVERFNPAVTVLLSLLKPEEIIACELQRLSTTPGRDRSADIIFDLMIHDLDLVAAFTQSEVAAVAAMGHCVRSALIDHVTAMLRFARGATATLTASSISQERVRRARIFTQHALFTVDFASREVWIHRHGKSSLAAEDGQYLLSSQVEQILVPPKEPLAVEQEHFFQAIRTGTAPLTSAEVGLAVLRTAYAIQTQVHAQQVPAQS